MIWVIEHLEPLSKWVKLEYMHCPKILGKKKLIFTNVKDAKEAAFLKKLGKVEEKSATELFANEKIIVLEPQAEKRLNYGDFKKCGKILIGGILGEAQPAGRTNALITSKLKNAAPRNIGIHQFSVDGAAFVAKKIHEMAEKDLGVLINPEIELSDMHSIELHYAIPVFKGEIIFTPGLVKYIKKEESWNNKE